MVAKRNARYGVRKIEGRKARWGIFNDKDKFLERAGVFRLRREAFAYLAAHDIDKEAADREAEIEKLRSHQHQKSLVHGHPLFRLGQTLGGWADTLRTVVKNLGTYTVPPEEPIMREAQNHVIKALSAIEAHIATVHTTIIADVEAQLAGERARIEEDARRETTGDPFATTP